MNQRDEKLFIQMDLMLLINFKKRDINCVWIVSATFSCCDGHIRFSGSHVSSLIPACFGAVRSPVRHEAVSRMFSLRAAWLISPSLWLVKPPSVVYTLSVTSSQPDLFQTNRSQTANYIPRQRWLSETSPTNRGRSRRLWIPPMGSLALLWRPTPCLC